MLILGNGIGICNTGYERLEGGKIVALHVPVTPSRGVRTTGWAVAMRRCGPSRESRAIIRSPVNPRSPAVTRGPLERAGDGPSRPRSAPGRPLPGGKEAGQAGSPSGLRRQRQPRANGSSDSSSDSSPDCPRPYKRRPPVLGIDAARWPG